MGKKAKKRSAKASSREVRGRIVTGERHSPELAEVEASSSLLSDELKAELGDDAILLPSEKKSSNGSQNTKRAKFTEEEIVQQKKMNKRTRRRVEQILDQKERDAKRSEFIEKLKQHSITREQQQLLTSTKLIGQTLSLKQKLQVLHRRHRAGLSLSEEEMLLLFPFNSLEAAEGIPSDKNFHENGDDGELEVVSTEEGEGNDGGEASSARDGNQGNKAFGAIPSLSSGLAALTPSEIQSTSWNGSIFMENFKALQGRQDKGQTKLEKRKRAHEKCSVLAELHEDEEGVESGSNKRKYVPKEIVLPFDESGCYIVSNKTLSSGKGLEEEMISKNRNYTIINRSAEIRESRMQLPICKMEQEIVEAVTENDAIIICGETGSGKSTQMPQFLYESGYGQHGMIAITQPRRVAATSTAERVAHEMGGGVCSSSGDGGLVGYQIRYDRSTVGKNTVIKFMTDGVLLREITSDILLRKYSVVILDEAHERNVNTDVLLGMISRTLPLRKKVCEEEITRWTQLDDKERAKFHPPLQPLKVIIMSATLRVEDFRNPSLFSPIPRVISVEARQYPITTHFSRVTEIENYLDVTFKKVCQIHRKLPHGGILVFLTGKKEISWMCKRLSKELNAEDVEARKELQDILSRTVENDTSGKEFDAFLRGLDEEEVDGDMQDAEEYEMEDEDEVVDIGDDDVEEEEEEGESEKDDIPSDVKGLTVTTREAMLREALGLPPLQTSSAGGDGANMESTAVTDVEEESPPLRARVLPLFAMLDSEAQAKVFGIVPQNQRLIVVATNVAETSITIPGIRYVVDCGRQKEKIMTKGASIASYDIRWISKASAEQRKGRAGRTGPGHCYRLYSSAFFDQHMQLYQEPEILRTPLEDLLLQMRVMGIERVEDFPFPSAPPGTVLNQAISVLTYLGAVKPSKSSSTIAWLYDSDGSDSKHRKSEMVNSSKITGLGAMLAKFPIGPRYAKILITAKNNSHEMLFYSILLVAAMSERSPFLPKRCAEDGYEERTGKVGGFSDGQLDLSSHGTSDVLARMRAFGSYLHAEKAMKKKPHSDLNQHQKEFCDTHFLHHDTLEKVRDLRQQLVALCLKHFKVSSEHVDLRPPSPEEEVALRQILMTGFCDSIARRAPAGTVSSGSRRKRMTAYISCDPSVTTPLYIHPESALYNSDPTGSLPEFVIYSELVKNQRGDVTYMSCVTSVLQQWISELARDCPLLQWASPLTSPTPYYDKKKDSIICYSIPKYGVHNWELDPVKLPMNLLISYLNDRGKNETQTIGYRRLDEHARWFARILMEGHIFPDLKIALKREHMKIKPAEITQMKPNLPITSLLKKIVEFGITNKEGFIHQLRNDRLFLCEEMQQFLYAEHRKGFRLLFKKMVAGSKI